MKKRKKWFAVGLICLVMLVVISCGRRQGEEPETVYKIYYVNRDGTGVLYHEYATASTDTDTVLAELLGQLETVPERLEYRAPLAADFTILDYSLSEGQLLLNFDENYKNQEIINEILVRASIVRTLTQVKEVQYISFLVSSQPLTDASGNVVGVMNSDNFIDNAGNEINTYERVRLRLYFANSEGNGLVAVSRNVVFSSNFSLERQVVEEIIAGPKDSDIGNGAGNLVYPVINSDTKVVSVNIRDGICYVNLDAGFLNQTYQVVPEVTIYAIVNSLVELSNVNRVQISINGETNVTYRESINLATMFERNLDLIG